MGGHNPVPRGWSHGAGHQSVENAIRPVALTERMRSLPGTRSGPKTGHCCPIVAACKLSDVNAVAYIAETRRAILDSHPQSCIEDLMPWRFRKASSLDASGIRQGLPLDRPPLNMKRTPNPSYRIHRLHPRTTRSQKPADGRKSSSKMGGQNWTPITPSRGSILHAETHPADICSPEIPPEPVNRGLHVAFRFILPTARVTVGVVVVVSQLKNNMAVKMLSQDPDRKGGRIPADLCL